MTRPRATRAALVLTASAVLVVFSLSGCTSPDDPVSSPVNDQPTISSPTPPTDDVPRDDLTEERVVEWTQAETVAENSIRVTFWAGTHRCFGSRYVLQETDDTIATAVIEGKFPDAPAACTEEARQASLLIETQQPVGDRDIEALSDVALNR